VPVSRYVFFTLLTVAGLATDLLSKAWAFQELGYPGHQSDWSWSSPFLWGRFSISFTTSFNKGALFGIGQGMTWLFALLSLVAVAFVIYWLFIRREARSWWLTVTLGLIMSGALGNLYDRLYLHGCIDSLGSPIYGVRDFVDCTIPFLRWEGGLSFSRITEYKWPIFNMADTFLVTGAIMLTLYSLFAPVPATAAEPMPAKGNAMNVGSEKRTPAAPLAM
jgi:signal peptidase II